MTLLPSIGHHTPAQAHEHHEPDKARLYIGFFDRFSLTSMDEESIIFHTALLLVPKDPQHNDAPESWLFHIQYDDAARAWTYEPRQVENRMDNLRVLQLLGKVAPEDTGDVLNGLFEEVDIETDDEAWRCRHWAWAAIERLVHEKKLAPLEGDATAQELWEKGYAFALRVNTHFKEPVPTCDQKGKPIKSEVKPGVLPPGYVDKLC